MGSPRAGRLTVIAALVPLLFTACASSSTTTGAANTGLPTPTTASAATPSSSAPAVDIAGFCAKLTAAEVAATVGNPVVASVPSPGNCEYQETANGDYSVSVQVSIATARSQGYFQNDKENQATWHSTMTTVEGQPVSFLAYGPRPGKANPDYSFSGRAEVITNGAVLAVGMMQGVGEPIVPDAVGLPKLRALVALALSKLRG